MTEKKLNNKPKRQPELNRGQRLWSNLSLPLRLLDPGLKQRWQKIALLAGFSLLAAVMVFPRPQALHFDYAVGDIAEMDIKASADFLVEDKVSSDKRQQEQLNQSPLIFDLDERIGPAINARLHQAFEFMRQTIQEAKKAAPGEVPATTASPNTAGAPSPPEAEVKLSFSKLYKVLLDKKPEFDRMLGVALPNNIFYLLARNYFSAQSEDVISQQVTQVISQGVFSEQNLPPADLQRPIIIRRLPSWHEKQESSASRFLELNDAKKKLNLYCREAAEDLASGPRYAICEVAQSLITPNVSLNRAETEQRKLAGLQNLRPVYFQIKKGEMLVREGEKITPTQLIKLQALEKDRPQGWWFWRFFGTWGLIALVAAFSYKLIRLNAKKSPRSLKELTFITVTLLAITLLDVGMVIFGGALTRLGPLVARNFLFYLPVALAPILIQFFIGMETAVLTAFIAAMLTALLVDKPFLFFIYFSLSGLVGVWAGSFSRTRWGFIRTGLYIAVVNFATVLALKLCGISSGSSRYFLGAHLCPGRGDSDRYPGHGPGAGAGAAL